MRLIKRYSNRKLYDTLAKSYITLEAIASIIERDEKFQILDNDTGEDITASVLSQLIAERARKCKEYSPSLFIDMIKKSSGSMYDCAKKIGHAIGETAYSVEEEIENKVKKLLSSDKITSEEKKQFHQELETHRLSYLKRIEEQLESVVDMVLKKVNVPTKKEIESLSASINQLSERIENLEKIKNFIETPKAEQVSSEKETPEAETAKEEEKGSTEHLA
ncbi:MAG: hypothetical protein HUU50_04475 [Candidatus Brocadiae bacterium]|nr:hypothetical protein [Candidatus Brocadiia bacterium]